MANPSEDTKVFQFSYSAPAKVILAGEHSVVYDRHSLATAINLTTTCKITVHKLSPSNMTPSSARDERRLHIRLLDDDLSVDLALNQLFSFLPKDMSDRSLYESTIEAIAELCSDQVMTLGVMQLLIIPTTLEKQIPNWSSCPEFWEEYRFDVEISSLVPRGSGLGSSASLGAAISACWTRVLLEMDAVVSGNPAKFDHIVNDTGSWNQVINHFAFEFESLIHGNPSGVDNTVVTYGGCILFNKKTRDFQVYGITHDIVLVLINSRVPKNTKKMVQGVAEFHQQFPILSTQIFDAIDTIVLDFSQLVQHEGNSERMGSIMRINHNFLNSIGVSHPKLEEIIRIGDRHDVKSKLTGGGGGGYAVAILSKKKYEEKLYGDYLAQIKAADCEYLIAECDELGIRENSLS
mmetsp:Transcript_28998/g.33171  ORF Transcript_28998/g.33171 Transcript_28998/m.33171 type:complete len:406 (+) Transcript_28998:22-1239(+)